MAVMTLSIEQKLMRYSALSLGIFISTGRVSAGFACTRQHSAEVTAKGKKSNTSMLAGVMYYLHAHIIGNSPDIL